MWSWRNIFQLTSSRRGWRHLIQFRYTGRKFQLTSSRRGWHKHNKKSPNPLHFNSHPHEEDDNFENTGMSSTYIFQLTSSRRGWRQKSFLSDLTVYISTHILTKRMTWPRRKMEVHWGISTHILTKRMTFTCPCTHNITFYFNSHPHEEDDCYRCISLPTWRYFNSHPHEEDDRRVQQAFQCPWYFNSHPHEEDDTIRLTARGYRYYFNSHPHEEDDYTIYLVWHE